MLHKKFDYIVVGQGLAGTCLAFTLEHIFKKRIYVIDKNSGAGCSRVAAGTFNPVSFKTFDTTWKAAELVPFLKQFYTEMSKSVESELMSESPIYKILKSEDQKAQWIKKSMMQTTSKFMHENVKETIEGVNAKLGFGEVKDSGNIHMVIKVFTGCKLCSLGIFNMLRQTVRPPAFKRNDETLLHMQQVISIFFSHCCMKKFPVCCHKGYVE